jgi:magnesium chelatase family protein
MQIQRYRSKLSGPLLDRIDLIIDVPRLTTEELSNTSTESEPSSLIRERVVKARRVQSKRFENDGIFTNSEMTARMIKKYCVLDDSSQKILSVAVQKYQLSGRRYSRVLKLARTIADLAGSDNIRPEHLTQALQYRGGDN